MNECDLEIWVRVVQGHWKWHHLIDRVRVPIRSAIVTIILCCIISEIERDFGRKNRDFFKPPAFDAPVSGVLSEYCR